VAVVYLALGSNQGERLEHLRAAVAALAAAMVVERSSSVYETAAAYVEDQPAFLNAVIVGSTSLSPHELLAALKAIENQMGRTAGVRFGPRPIDLDILLYDDLTLSTPELVIPHPRMDERAFVLRPLAELDPERVSAAMLARAEIGAVMALVAPPLY
jgi:2-amino-4-hydroxy-6-hydroxymethyldihydropteridine diphosphokinase